MPDSAGLRSCFTLIAFVAIACGDSEPPAVPVERSAERVAPEAPVEPPRASRDELWDPCRVPVAEGPARECARAGTPAALFEAGSGCGADFEEESGVPCSQYFGPDLRIGSARARIVDGAAQVDLVASSLREGEGERILCQCAGDLRALGYSEVRTPEGSLHARSTVDRVDVTLTDGELRYAWHSLGEIDALYRHQLFLATGVGHQEDAREMGRRIDDLAEAME